MASASKRWLDIEGKYKVDFEQRLALVPIAQITRIYSDAEWKAVEQVQKTLPGFAIGLGRDERSTAGKTRKTFRDDEEIEEIEDVPTEDAEPADIDETESEPIDNTEAICESLEDITEDESEFEDMAEAA